MFRLNQTLHAQRRMEALLQGRRSRQKSRRAGDPLPVGNTGDDTLPPANSKFLDRRRRRLRRNAA